MAVSVRKRTPWLGVIFFVVGMLLPQLTLMEEREVASVVRLGHDVVEEHDVVVFRDKMNMVHGSVAANKDGGGGGGGPAGGRRQMSALVTATEVWSGRGLHAALSPGREEARAPGGARRSRRR